MWYRSGAARSRVWRATQPSSASSARQPHRRKYRATALRMVGSSSTTSARRTAMGGPGGTTVRLDWVTGADESQTGNRLGEPGVERLATSYNTILFVSSGKMHSPHSDRATHGGAGL